MTAKRGVLVTALGLLGLSLFGCNQGGEGAKGAAASTAAAGAAAQPAKPAGPCEAYATALCDKAGAESATCGEAKSLTAIMSPKACTAGSADIDFTVKALAEKRKVCDDLAAKLCKDIGEQTETCKMVKEQTPNFPPDRCTAMMGQYDRVVADLKSREAANQPLDAAKQAAIAQGTTLVAGPENAKVTLVEFSDFQCPYCSKAAETLSEIKKKYPNNVRVVFRQFPLSFHENAHLAAEAAAAAGAQGKFWQYHDLLFKNQKALTRPDLEKYAKEIGLNMAEFNKALDSKTFAEAVDADMKLGGEVGVNGTPSMFLNGKRVQNAMDVGSLSVSIDEQLKANP